GAHLPGLGEKAAGELFAAPRGDHLPGLREKDAGELLAAPRTVRTPEAKGSLAHKIFDQQPAVARNGPNFQTGGSVCEDADFKEIN
ncbi:MAG: hypothetical protein IIC52_06260, partial [Proteobacteria bacterium]|nr:hypothetical protein [Pseudomonadota bacterium]